MRGFRFCENRDMRRFISIGGIVLCVKKAPKRRIFSGHEGDKKDVSGNDETGMFPNSRTPYTETTSNKFIFFCEKKIFS